jgi:hypothetical protein
MPPISSPEGSAMHEGSSTTTRAGRNLDKSNSQRQMTDNSVQLAHYESQLPYIPEVDSSQNCLSDSPAPIVPNLNHSNVSSPKGTGSGPQTSPGSIDLPRTTGMPSGIISSADPHRRSQSTTSSRSPPVQGGSAPPSHQSSQSSCRGTQSDQEHQELNEIIASYQQPREPVHTPQGSNASPSDIQPTVPVKKPNGSIPEDVSGQGTTVNSIPATFGFLNPPIAGVRTRVATFARKFYQTTGEVMTRARKRVTVFARKVYQFARGVSQDDKPGIEGQDSPENAIESG